MTDKLNEWTFPGSTCELPCHDCFFTQPVSATICAVAGLLMVGLAFYYRRQTRLALAHTSYAIFSFRHALSHARPLLKLSVVSLATQMHLLTYAMAIATVATVAERVGLPEYSSSVGRMWYTILTMAILLDIMVFIWIGGVWVAVSGLMTCLLLIAGVVPFLDRPSLNRFIRLCVGVVVVLCVDFYEVTNCNQEAASWKIPLHAFLESTGIFVFLLLSDFVARAQKKL